MKTGIRIVVASVYSKRLRVTRIQLHKLAICKIFYWRLCICICNMHPLCYFTIWARMYRKRLISVYIYTKKPTLCRKFFSIKFQLGLQIFLNFIELYATLFSGALFIIIREYCFVWYLYVYVVQLNDLEGGYRAGLFKYFEN